MVPQRLRTKGDFSFAATTIHQSDIQMNATLPLATASVMWPCGHGVAIGVATWEWRCAARRLI